MDIEKVIALPIIVVITFIVIAVVLQLFSSWFCKTKITTIARDEQGRITEVVERCI